MEEYFSYSYEKFNSDVVISILLDYTNAEL